MKRLATEAQRVKIAERVGNQYSASIFGRSMSQLVNNRKRRVNETIQRNTVKFTLRSSRFLSEGDAFNFVFTCFIDEVEKSRIFDTEGDDKTFVSVGLLLNEPRFNFDTEKSKNKFFRVI